ncbi:MAG: hypothetical protein BMS9Abin37_3222 [Acidobacteriota bacterium]|nr:MAG: hypothetical protein BMS9Abin37_3222 [Acidobacteriota bacterium]
MLARTRSTGPFATSAVVPYGDEAVYELEWSETGDTMTTASATPSGEAVSYYWKTLVEERDQYYQPALLRASDRWLWDVLLSKNVKTYPVDIDALVHQDHERLGDAVLAAQKTYASSGAFPELLAIYHLFGDPALRLK